MKNMNDVIAALSGEQKKNDYELVELLQNEFADFDIEEIAALTYSEVEHKLNCFELLNGVITREIESEPSDLMRWAYSSKNQGFVDEARLNLESARAGHSTFDFYGSTIEVPEKPITDVEVFELAFYNYHHECCLEQLQYLVDLIHSASNDFLNSKKSAIA